MLWKERTEGTVQLQKAPWHFYSARSFIQVALRKAEPGSGTCVCVGVQGPEGRENRRGRGGARAPGTGRPGRWGRISRRQLQVLWGSWGEAQGFPKFWHPHGTMVCVCVVLCVGTPLCTQMPPTAGSVSGKGVPSLDRACLAHTLSCVVWGCRAGSQTAGRKEEGLGDTGSAERGVRGACH